MFHLGSARDNTAIRMKVLTKGFDGHQIEKQEAYEDDASS